MRSNTFALAQAFLGLDVLMTTTSVEVKERLGAEVVNGYFFHLIQRGFL
jgi:hypothetical protein